MDASDGSESSDDESDSVLLFQLFDADQEIIPKTRNEKNPKSPLHSYDPKWDQNMTFGDVEKRRIKNLPGQDPEKTKDIWFPIKDSKRKVFCAIKIKRCSEMSETTVESLNVHCITAPSYQ